MKKAISLLICVLMITSMVNFSSIVNAVTSIELPEFSTEETVDTDETTQVAETEEVTEPPVEDNGLVEKTITGYYNGYTIEVFGMLPAVATLSLTSVDNISAQKLVAEMSEDGKAVFACDIKILDADGNEWQPDTAVNVKVTGIDEIGQNVQFLHISEDIETVLAEENPKKAVHTITSVTKGENGDVSFDTDSFSTFVGFTVEFHYDGQVFSMSGEETVKLSEIFEQLGLTYDVADVESVSFSDKTLVKVEKDGEDWNVTSLEPFSTNEKLTVTFKDGETLEIRVTDYATDSITIGTLDNSSDAVGGACGAQSVAGLTITPHTTYSDADPKTIDYYTISGSIASGTHLTIYVAGHIQLAAASTIKVPTGTKLTMVNTYSEDVYLFRGNLSTAETDHMIKVEASAALELKGNTNGNLVFDGRNPDDKVNLLVSAVSTTQPSIRSRLINIAGGTAAGDTSDSISFERVTLQNAYTRDSSDDGPATRGSGVLINGYHSTVSVTNSTFSALNGRYGRYMGGSAFRFDSKYIGNNVTFTDCTFNDCKTTRNEEVITNSGGALSFVSGASVTNVTIQGSSNTSRTKFTNCSTASSRSSGGAIYTAANIGTFKMIYCDFDTCKTTNYRGGAISFGDQAVNPSTVGSVNISYCSFNACTASGLGGAVLVLPGTVFTTKFAVTNSTFTSCSATYGGAICCNLKDAIVIPQFDLSGNTYTSCSSSTGEGGAVRIVGEDGKTTYTTVNLNNTTATSCTSKISGAVFSLEDSTFGTVNINNGTFNNNNATTLGGSIFIESTSKVQDSTYIKNNTFINCTSGDEGGAICCDGSYQKLCIGNDVDSSTDDNENVSNKFYNCTSGSAGAIRILGKTVKLSINRNYIEDCKATGNYGGAICIAEGANTSSEFRMNENRFINASAKRGGGAFLMNASIGTSTTPATVAELNNNAFLNCKVTEAATESAVSRGGAVYFYTASRIYADEILFQYDDNFSTYNSQDTYMNPSMVDANGNPKLVNYVAAFDNCSTSTKWSYNTTTDNFIKWIPYGGGICMDCDQNNINQFTFHVKPGVFDSLHVFKECKSHVSGAIGFPHDSSKNMFKKIIIDYGPEKGVLDDGPEYDGNAHDGVLRNRTGKTFKDCYALRSGAIIDQTNTSVPYIAFDGVIADGSMATEGSAIAIGDVKIEDYIIKDSIIENSYAPKLLNFNTYGGTIKTKGSTACIMTIDNTTLRNNKSHWSGGGIYWNAGDFATLSKTSATIKNCMFDNNHAVYAGGGIYNEAVMSIYNTVVRKNTSATVGGGIKTTLYVNDSTAWNASKIDLTIGAGCEIYENKAGLFGGGIGVHMRYSQNVLYNMSNKVYSKFAMNFTMNDVFTAEDVREGYVVGGTIPEDLQPKVMNNVAGLHGGGIYYGLGHGSYADGWDSYIDDTSSAKWGKKTNMSDCKAATDSNKQKVLNSIVKNINIKSGVISGNKAGYDGGGIYANVDRTVINISNGKIYENSAGISNDVITLIDDVNDSYKDGFKPTFSDANMEKYRSETLSVKNADGTYFTPKNIRLDESITGFGGGIALKGVNSVCNITGGFIGQANTDSDGSDALNHKYANRADFGGAIAVKEGTVNITSPYVLDGATTFNLSSLYSAYGVAFDFSKIPANIQNSDNENIGLPVVSANGKYIATRDTVNKDWILTKNPEYDGADNEEMISVELQDESVLYFTVADKATEAGNISYNYSKGGAGIYTMGSGTINIANGNIHHNHAEASGILNKDTSDVDLTITNIDTYSDTKISEIEKERTTAIVNALTPGSGGGVYANAGTVTLTGGNVYNNTATNGAGGGVYAVSGGDVTMKGGMLHSNKAEATEVSASTTAYYDAELKGVGGAIAVGKGTSSNNSTFTLVDSSAVNMAIYNNIADFAADDVYASGQFTDLDVPNSANMDIPNPNNEKMLVGWYEDFHDGDTTYVGHNDNMGRASSINEIQRYRTGEIKFRVFDVNTGVTVGNVTKQAANAAKTFVCMTLGIVHEGAIKIGKTVQDIANKSLDGSYSESYKFKITGHYDSDNEVYAEQPSFLALYDEDGVRIPDGTIEIVSDDATNHTYTFRIKNGTSATFRGMGYYTVEEILEGNQNSYVSSTRYVLSNSSGTSSNIGKTTKQFHVSSDAPSEVIYYNTVKSLSIDLKYYDRKIVLGQPSDMSDTPKTVSVTVSGKDYYTATSNTTSTVQYADLAKIINYAAVAAEVDNGNGIKTKLAKFIENMVDQYTVYSEASKAPTTYHYNQYGEEVASTTTDPLWINWYDKSNVPISVTDDSTAANAYKGVVWLHNTPRQYTVNFYCVSGTKDSTATVMNTGMNKYTFSDGTTRYVPTIKSSIQTPYYNQRIGTERTESDAGNTNDYTNHLNQYNKLGYTEKDETSAGTVNYNGTPVYFSHWSDQPDGSTIVSTDYYYSFRVTQNQNIYAVYMPTIIKDKGLTVSANPTDTYVEGTVEKTRLNTMVNPYNFKDYAGETMIGNLAGVYVVADTTTTITPEIVVSLQTKILEQIEAWKVEDFTTNQLKSAKITGVDGVKGANFVVYYNPTLTNKNRVNMTVEFSNTTLANKRMLTFAAIHYKYGTGANEQIWRISDNCIEYKFDANGKNTGVSSIFEATAKKG